MIRETNGKLMTNHELKYIMDRFHFFPREYLGPVHREWQRRQREQFINQQKKQ